MKTSGLVAIVLTLIIVASSFAGCSQPMPATPTPRTTPTAGSSSSGAIRSVDGPIDGYLAVAPRVLRSAQTEFVAVSLFSGQQPANGTVQVVLLQGTTRVAEAAGTIRGKGDVALKLPKLSEGEYQLQLSGQGFQAQSPIRVEEGTLVFVETDKPIYKPGQTFHIRVLTLDPQLKPVEGSITVEVMDAKGTKVFKKDVQTDDYGMVNLDMPLSPEPNLGTWKVVAKAGKRSAQVDVRVERYVLPKYEVRVDLPKDWVLASESITGSVSAEYSYGKAVKGEVEIRATRYVGTWEEFAKVTRNLDGRVDFQLPPVQYVSGVPGARGMGHVQLEVTVREEATGYEEKTTHLVSIAASPVTLRVIPDSVIFKPSLPLSLLVVAETPDKKPVDAKVGLEIAYTKGDGKTSHESRQMEVKQGKGIIKLTPPADAVALTLNASSGAAHTSLAMQSGYSPTGSFILVEPANQTRLKVGDTAQFRVSSTKQAGNYYFEVVARGTVVFSDFTPTSDIAFPVSPLMAPTSRLLVYQIQPNSEVAADYIPFNVDGAYPQEVEVTLSTPEVKPGDPIDVTVQTEGPAKVGLAAVDRSVFILAENRLNLQQVFDELERLYQTPQAELHEVRPLDKIVARGAKDVFADAGVVVLSNKQVPSGKEYASAARIFEMRAGGIPQRAAVDAAKSAEGAVPPAVPAAAPSPQPEGLAEVQRVRQFFPETWVWTDLLTDAAGKASKRFDAPDSITTWMLRAVALSKQTGLGIAEAQLRVFQPFFTQVDLPYSAIRGEQFPVKVALYNYQDKAQEFTVDLERADWFELLDQASKTVEVGPNGVGGVSFTIRPSKLGTRQVKVTARSREAADAIVKDLIVEPEGVQREQVENLVVSAGSSREVSTAVPNGIIEGSARAYLALTGNYLTQTIEGLERLLQMPFGCGEQNMILFAPNVFVARYLKETGQMKPEVMAKAENLMITGYQRELTYRRSDGSFSAFGENDEIGSLWLTAFVLKTFAQAKDLIYIDDGVLSAAKSWVVKQQKQDGSFEPVGFVHHQEMLGGLKGKTALTAYLAVALREAGENEASGRAIRYLEGQLDAIDDPYTLALTAYALELAKSARAAAAHDKLMASAKDSDEGLHWDGGQGGPVPLDDEVAPPGQPGRLMPSRLDRSAAIETTAYATLALVEHGDRLNAARAARWLVSRRNSYGGFGSTQDTVVGLQALTRYAAGAKADVDATVTLRSGNWQKDVRISPENSDVLQVVDVPIGDAVSIEVKGQGQVVLQSVRRFNIPDPAKKEQSVFQMEVTYSAGQIEVDDLIDVTARLRFTPPEPVQAGMVVLDVAVPTGFAPETDTIDALVQQRPKIKRYEVSGRKVIFYIEDMAPDEQIELSFKARALYPVKAQAVASQAYSYYKPDWKGESLGGALTVGGGS